MSMISDFAKNPGPNHFSTIDQILRYLANSPERNITFREEYKLNFIKYSDSDWVEDHIDRKSIS